MYYGTTMHESRPVASASAAAALIQGRVDEAGDHLRDFDALIWEANGRKLCAVANNHANNPWFEVAVLDLTRAVQIESITAGWMDETESLAAYLRQCETTEFTIGTIGTFPLDGNGASAIADFECGCCGTYFQSTLAKQRAYDQDAGFGICDKCA